MPRTASVFMAAIENAKSPEGAAVAVGLPQGWKLLQNVTPSEGRVLRIYDLDGAMFPSFEAVQRCHGDQVFAQGVPSLALSEKDPDGVGATTCGSDDFVGEGGDVSVECQTKKGNRRARALALGDGDAVVALEKAREMVRDAEKVIEARKSHLLEMATNAETEKQKFEAASAEVREAEQIEAEVARRLEELKRKRREAENEIVAKTRKLDETNAMLLMLDMEVARGAATAASQQIANDEFAMLERVANEAQRAIEEHQKREREAREKMKKLLKEQKRISYLGPFGRRMRVATQTKAIMDGNAADARSSTSEAASLSSSAPLFDQAATCVSTDPSVVKIKREVLEAFGAHRAKLTQESEPVVISIDDDSQ